MMSQEEEEQFGPLLVGTLEQHGIAATDVKKLTVCLYAYVICQKSLNK